MRFSCKRHCQWTRPFKHPVCLAGANACPPEDCGGIPGYYDLLAALADPKHEQHEEMKEWVGGAWDSTRFSLEDVNAGLKRIKAYRLQVSGTGRAAIPQCWYRSCQVPEYPAPSV